MTPNNDSRTRLEPVSNHVSRARESEQRRRYRKRSIDDERDIDGADPSIPAYSLEDNAGVTIGQAYLLVREGIANEIMVVTDIRHDDDHRIAGQDIWRRPRDLTPAEFLDQIIVDAEVHTVVSRQPGMYIVGDDIEERTLRRHELAELPRKRLVDVSRSNAFGDPATLNADGSDGQTVTYTDNGLLAHLQELADDLGRVPTPAEIDGADGPDTDEIVDSFGTLGSAFNEAGIDGDTPEGPSFIEYEDSELEQLDRLEASIE